MLVDCDHYNKGCNGGDFTYAWQYVKEKGGAVQSANYPYVSGTTLTVIFVFRNFLKIKAQ